MWCITSLGLTILRSRKSSESAWLLRELTIHRNFNLEDVHVTGAKRIAEAVAKYDVDRFIHISSSGASEGSPSEFYRTKVYNYPTLYRMLCSERSFS